ncbi:MAG: hypothetical protein FWG36_06210 [Oscillospiraceae bacterium]|nr:hypothetical protein [Oscillospiraceae bacterium]
MPTNTEIRVMQKTLLFKLLLLKKELGGNKNFNVLIAETKAAMESEDVAYVEKMIKELD